MNKVIDFTKSDEAFCLLAKAEPKASGMSNHLQDWVLDLAFLISEEPENVESIIPMATEYVRRAREGVSSATISIKPTDAELRFSMFDMSQDALIEDATAELLNLKMTVNEKNQSCVARIKLLGVMPSDCVGFISGLGGKVKVRTEPSQASFDFPPEPTGLVIDAQTEEYFEIASVISEGKEQFGVVVKTLKGVGVSDFGVIYNADSFSSQIHIPSTNLPWLERYEKVCQSYGENPSWEHLIVSAALHLGDDEEEFILNEEIIDSAVGLLLKGGE